MKRRGRRSRPLENSADVVLRSLTQVGLTDQARRLRIARHWRQAVGPHIAARTRVQSFGRGVLLIKAASSAWQQELGYLKDSIITKLNKLLEQPSVRDIRVLSGHWGTAGQPAPAAPARSRNTAAHRAQAKKLSEPIGDAATREAFERLLLTALGRSPRAVPPG